LLLLLHLLLIVIHLAIWSAIYGCIVFDIAIIITTRLCLIINIIIVSDVIVDVVQVRRLLLLRLLVRFE
jgi:hypothetical protein